MYNQCTHILNDIIHVNQILLTIWLADDIMTLGFSVLYNPFVKLLDVLRFFSLIKFSTNIIDWLFGYHIESCEMGI